MNYFSHRFSSALLALLGLAGFAYFLLSTALWLPPEPEFARLTMDKPLVNVDGRHFIAIHGLELMMQLSLGLNLALFALLALATFSVVILSAFIAVIQHKGVLVLIASLALINVVYIGFIVVVFNGYVDLISVAAGGVGMLLLLLAVYLRLGGVRVKP